MQLELFEDEAPKEETKEGQLKCPTCKQYKPKSSFHDLSKADMVAKKPKRTGALRNCKTCYSENARLLYALKKENKYPQVPTCNCCGTTPQHYDKLQLDHCHETKVFRGWLCRSCNTGIGILGDDLDGLTNALAYLKRHYYEQP